MKISIITVCYNSADTIEDTIRSVLSQGYEDIEYIVVDGGSKDGTIDILNKYRDNIDKYISEPDKGVYDAMNKGIMLATGDLIGFINADDFYTDNNVIRQIIAAFEDNDVDCCYGDLEYVDGKDLSKVKRRWKSQPYREGLFEKGWHPPHPTFIVKKNIYDRFGSFDLDYDIGSDYELMLRFLRKFGIKYCYIPHVLVRMRIGGISNKNLWHIVKANIECYRAWEKNGLRVNPFIMLKKPASKLVQYM